MKYGNIIIEKKEYELLESLLRSAHDYKDESYKTSIAKLGKELKNVTIRKEKDFPNDVIRFNSIVEIETPDGIKRSYQLVRPEHSNVADNKISILAPLGSALIGYAKGDEVIWHFPTGEKAIKIIGVTNSETIKKETAKIVK